jgi:hypothetical protein
VVRLSCYLTELEQTLDQILAENLKLSKTTVVRLSCYLAELEQTSRPSFFQEAGQVMLNTALNGVTVLAVRIDYVT